RSRLRVGLVLNKGRELTARGKTHHADARGIDLPFACAITHHSYRLAQIRERLALDAIRGALGPGQTTAKDEGCNTHPVELLCDELAFEIDDEVSMRAARRDHDRRAVRFLCRRQIN